MIGKILMMELKCQELLYRLKATLFHPFQSQWLNPPHMAFQSLKIQQWCKLNTQVSKQTWEKSITTKFLDKN